MTRDQKSIITLGLLCLNLSACSKEVPATAEAVQEAPAAAPISTETETKTELASVTPAVKIQAPNAIQALNSVRIIELSKTCFTTESLLGISYKSYYPCYGLVLLNVTVPQNPLKSNAEDLIATQGSGEKIFSGDNLLVVLQTEPTEVVPKSGWTITTHTSNSTTKDPNEYKQRILRALGNSNNDENPCGYVLAAEVLHTDANNDPNTKLSYYSGNSKHSSPVREARLALSTPSVENTRIQHTSIPGGYAFDVLGRTNDATSSMFKFSTIALNRLTLLDPAVAYCEN